MGEARLTKPTVVSVKDKDGKTTELNANDIIVATGASVTSEPYRFSRNPIYLGFVFTLIGLPLALGNYWGVVLGPLLMVLLYSLVIKHEEAYLEKKFEDVYTSYKSCVMWWL
jgi:protein-S-isoprenylcysteine O-methyltransferase Ste14